MVSFRFCEYNLVFYVILCGCFFKFVYEIYCESIVICKYGDFYILVYFEVEILKSKLSNWVFVEMLSIFKNLLWFC